MAQAIPGGTKIETSEHSGTCLRKKAKSDIQRLRMRRNLHRIPGGQDSNKYEKKLLKMHILWPSDATSKNHPLIFTYISNLHALWREKGLWTSAIQSHICYVRVFAPMYVYTETLAGRKHCRRLGIKLSIVTILWCLSAAIKSHFAFLFVLFSIF